MKSAAAEAWRADGPDCRRVLVIVAVACALLPASFAVKLVLTQDRLFPDFFGLWSFGRFVLTQPPATVYDDAAVHAFQATLGFPADVVYAFLYPPPILLVLAPFGAMPYGVARVAWLVVTFAAYAAALRAWRWPWLPAALLLLAPATAVCLLVGQTGFLIAALMLGGLRWLRTRPLLGGALLAVVGCKPQLALLVPFALLFTGTWRALLGAALMAAALVLATTLAFGPEIWGAWLETMRGSPGRVGAGRDALLEMMPTLTSAALLLGAGPAVALAVQAAGALAGVLALWLARRRQDAAAQAVLPQAALLATPYAFHYDLPLLTGALLAVVAARMTEPGGRFGRAEFPLLLAGLVVPVILPAHVGAAAAVLPAIFAATLWILARPRDSVAQPALPSRPAAA